MTTARKMRGNVTKLAYFLSKGTTMDIFHAFSESIEQFSDLYNIPMDAAKIAVPAILIIGTIGYMSSGNIADALLSSLQ